MSNEWLSALSFERTQQLITAINTVSIYTKLRTKGLVSHSPIQEVEAARGYLLDFLGNVEPIVEQMEANADQPAIGTDPRLGELAQGLLDSKRERRAIATSVEVSIPELRHLLETSNPPRPNDLIHNLRELRKLVEQHSHVDVANILGEI